MLTEWIVKESKTSI